MKFVLASGNQHKADEIGALLPSRFELILQKSLGVESPDETGTTFIENAIIKAKHASLATGLPESPTIRVFAFPFCQAALEFIQLDTLDRKQLISITF